MGWKPWQKKMIKLSEISLFSLLLETFHFLSITTLSLLLPLSFLLLARISSAQFFFSSQTEPSRQHPETSFLTSLFLYRNPTLLHALVAIITLSSLIHTLSGRISVEPDQPVRPRLHYAWILLCTLQVCVGLGIEASIEAGVDGNGFSKKSNGLFSKVVFFVGVHETMMHWCRSVVKPVVDDTVWGHVKAERWVERAVMTAGCAGLWWLRLRDEVDALVGVVEAKMETVVGGAGVGDFVGWWLYYVVVTIGIGRILKGVLWVLMVMFFKRWEGTISGDAIGDSLVDDDDDEDHV